MNRNQPDITLPKEVKIGKYVAKITQSGTAAPTATVLQNTTGRTITFERASQGIYNLIAAGEDFITTPATLNLQSSNGLTIIGTAIFNETKYGFRTTNSTNDTLEDDRLTQTPLILEIFNY